VRRTGSFAAVDQIAPPSGGAAGQGHAPAVGRPAERRTGSFAAVARPADPIKRRTGAFAAVDKSLDGVPDKPLSPAVSGILRLRGRTGQMPAQLPVMTSVPTPAISEDVATGDVEADELWAREILAATGGRR